MNNKTDIEVVKHAKSIMEYCKKHEMCKDCIFEEMECILTDTFRLPKHWILPEQKTYKQDFLEKFPDADFNADCICRKCVYPNSGEHPNCNNDKCEQCWNKTYIEGV